MPKMVPYIWTPREHHAVKDLQQYQAKHASTIRGWQKAGGRQTVHDSPTPLFAYISGNQWVVMCECGAGNSTDPEWGIACCFACGAVHRSIQFPSDFKAIEAALLERESPNDRNWLVGEPLSNLLVENVEARVIGETPMLPLVTS